MKRAFDLSAALLGLALLAPAMAAIALAVRLGDGGPVIFSQERVGRFGRPFWMHKFRTMVPEAERIGPLLTVGPDPRITHVGRWLRKTKLDELPQLWNVVRGEMSLVGPRPEVPRYVAAYTDEQLEVLSVRPGITDPASIAYIHEAELLAASDAAEELYLREIMPAKLACNLAYLRGATLASDVATIVKTVRRLMGRRSTTVVDSSRDVRETRKAA